MRKFVALWIAFLWVASAASLPAQPPPAAPYGRAGALGVETIAADWRDAARSRDVPVRIYYPKDAADPLPVIIFSHGLGGSREGYAYLGRHWASHGYVSVHPTHLGSDTAVLRGGGGRPYEAMQRAAADPRNAIERPRDISFVIDQLTSMSRGAGPFHGRLDLDRIGVAGHSFGGYTALAAAGQTFLPRGKALTAGDPRIKAAIAMSAPAKPGDAATLDRTYGSIKIPCLHMTGTLDDSPIGETKAADRRIPFDHCRGADQYLMILTGGDHMIFSGRVVRFAKRPKDDRFQALILMGATAFWDAYLKGDAAAKAWLAGRAFARELGGDGTFEKKIAD